MSSWPTPRPQVTELLVAWGGGDRLALERLVPLVEAELRRLSRYYLRRERKGHVLQTTALVNETFTRLLGWKDVSWQNRAHFFGMAARLMRNILVDLARHRPKGLEGQDVQMVDVGVVDRVGVGRTEDLIAIDDALQALARKDARQAQIVELRFFGGLTLPEIAVVLGVAPITVSREWTKARAWLYRELSRPSEG
jgi:RNA polymerase sigma-70 factor (ECF subfamily)